MLVARTLAASALCLMLPAASFAQAAPPAPPPSQSAPPALPDGMQAPTLSKQDVESLVVLIPEVARLSAKMQADPSRATPPAPGMAPMPVEQLKQLESVLQKHNYTFPEFFMKMTALVSTYMVLRPGELEKRLPTEQNPDVRRILDDPDVSDEAKQRLRAEIKEAQQKKGEIRGGLETFATPENRRAVEPMLAKVQKALDEAEKAGR